MTVPPKLMVGGPPVVDTMTESNCAAAGPDVDPGCKVDHASPMKKSMFEPVVFSYGETMRPSAVKLSGTVNATSF